MRMIFVEAMHSLELSLNSLCCMRSGQMQGGELRQELVSRSERAW